MIVEPSRASRAIRFLHEIFHDLSIVRGSSNLETRFRFPFDRSYGAVSSFGEISVFSFSLSLFLAGSETFSLAGINCRGSSE